MGWTWNQSCSRFIRIACTIIIENETALRLGEFYRFVFLKINGVDCNNWDNWLIHDILKCRKYDFIIKIHLFYPLVITVTTRIKITKQQNVKCHWYYYYLFILMLRYIFPWIVCLNGLIFFKICVIVSTNFSLDTPVFLFLNLVRSSVVVIGLRIKYRLTASSVMP